MKMFEVEIIFKTPSSHLPFNAAGLRLSLQSSRR